MIAYSRFDPINDDFDQFTFAVRKFVVCIEGFNTCSLIAVPDQGSVKWNYVIFDCRYIVGPSADQKDFMIFQSSRRFLGIKYFMIIFQII